MSEQLQKCPNFIHTKEKKFHAWGLLQKYLIKMIQTFKILI